MRHESRSAAARRVRLTSRKRKYHMSIKKKVFAVAATITMVGGVSAVGLMSANAATPSCGDNCVTGFGEEYGTSFVLDVLRQGEKVGQPLILFRASNSDPAEDFTYSDQGTVDDFQTAGLVSKALALKYGTDEAYELEYSPYGVNSGLCTGVGSTAGNGTPVSLQPCGASSKTVWVVDSTDPNTGPEFYPVINGSDTNFSHPYVLHYPGNAYPTDMPRPQLNTYMLQTYSDGSYYNNELFGQYQGNNVP
jgi:hypothetical protein